jgi:hypothetical protein
MPNLAESLLAQAAGRARAAAIYGDLTELAQTRGHFWFWTAYARTIVSFAWRWPVAVAVGYFSFTHLQVLFARWIWHAYPTWSGIGGRPHFTLIYIGLDALMCPLLFAVPFALLRYGVRDRFVQISCIACVAFLFVTSAFLYVPGSLPIAAGSASLILAAALPSREWRRATALFSITLALSLFALLASSVLPALALTYALTHPAQFFSQHGKSYFLLTHWLELLALGLVALACSRLHARLLDRRTTEHEIAGYPMA